MKAKYWLMSGISSIAVAYFLKASYQSWLSKNSSAGSFDFSTAQGYETWTLTFTGIGWLALIIGAVLIVFQKSDRNRWHRWYRLLASGFLLSTAWAIVGASVQTFTGDLLFWWGYQKPSNIGYSQLEQLFQANNWKEADEQTSRMIRSASVTTGNRRLDPTFDSFNRLPCADFQEIDRLWVQYSHDRFGFSIQRRIYESLPVPESAAPGFSAAKMEAFLQQVNRSGNFDPKFSREDAIGSLPSSGIWISTPYSSIQLFATESSLNRQKWCGF